MDLYHVRLVFAERDVLRPAHTANDALLLFADVADHLAPLPLGKVKDRLRLLEDRGRAPFLEHEYVVPAVAAADFQHGLAGVERIAHEDDAAPPEDALQPPRHPLEGAELAVLLLAVAPPRAHRLDRHRDRPAPGRDDLRLERHAVAPPAEEPGSAPLLHLRRVEDEDEAPAERRVREELHVNEPQEELLQELVEVAQLRLREPVADELGGRHRPLLAVHPVHLLREQQHVCRVGRVVPVRVHLVARRAPSEEAHDGRPHERRAVVERLLLVPVLQGEAEEPVDTGQDRAEPAEQLERGLAPLRHLPRPSAGPAVQPLLPPERLGRTPFPFLRLAPEAREEPADEAFRTVGRPVVAEISSTSASRVWELISRSTAFSSFQFAVRRRTFGAIAAGT